MDPFTDLLLQKRFLVQRYFASGAFGKFYSAIDLKDNQREVLIKLSKEL
jgi:hypothetical protein